MKKLGLGLAVLAITSTSVMAADSVELTVTGTITPAACTPTLSGSGVADYGNIRAADLTAGVYKDLGIKTLDFAITCDAPAKVAIKAVSGRPGTVVSDQVEGSEGFAAAPINLFGVTGVDAAGLGLAGAAKIGGYAARIVPLSSQADSTAVDTIISTDSGTTWSTTTASNITSNQQILSWAASTTNTPVALSALAAEVEVNAYLNKPEELDLTQAVNLDGLTTIEVVYL